MGLTAIANAAARIGFTAAGDTKKAVTLYMGPSGSFNATNDTSAITYAHTVPDVQAVVWDEAQKDGEDGPRATKTMAMVKAVDLPATPEENDKATIGGKTYDIKNVETDPAGATHTLTLLE